MAIYVQGMNTHIRLEKTNCIGTIYFLRAAAATAVAHFSHRNSVRPSVRLSVCHMGGSVKNAASCDH